MNNIYIYILIMSGVICLTRILPLTLIRKPIKNKFIKSFLYYVPYVTLSIMTFPAIMYATDKPVAGFVALIVGIVLSYKGAGLFQVAIGCCGTVFIIEMII